jgi:ribosomal protein S21
MPVIFNRVKALSPGKRNADRALRALKKMQREGIFREMKLRRNHEKPSERQAREQAEAPPRGGFVVSPDMAGRTRRRQVMSFPARLM